MGKNRSPLGHIFNSIVRFPVRTWRSTVRMVDPQYFIQWKANWIVWAWLPKARADLLRSIPGTSSFREGTLLCHLASTAPRGGEIVEIGAFKGKSTAWITEGATHRRDKLPIVSIDPHTNNSWDEYNKTVDRFDLRNRGLTIHRSFSHEIGKDWNRPISLLWVDGGHEYEDVVLDIDDFVPHVLKGAYVVFDDAAGGKFPGVERAIAEKMVNRPGFKDVAAIKNFRFFRRVQ